MEFENLNKLLKTTNFKLEKSNYLYHHSINGYPLKKDMDMQKIFYIIEVNNESVNTIELIDGDKKEISYNDFDENWWYLRLPESVRILLNIDRVNNVG